MNDEIKRRLSIIREAMNNSPQWIRAGQLNPPAPESSPASTLWSSFYDLCAQADGSRMGSVDFWSRAEAPSKQFTISEAIPNGAQWLAIGQLLYDPLALDEQGRLVLLQATPTMTAQHLGTLDDFLMSLLSARYRGIVPDGEMDDWWQLLGSVGLIGSA
jgi:hypothetical protein